jgi:hypothetical protein
MKRLGISKNIKVNKSFQIAEILGSQYFRSFLKYFANRSASSQINVSMVCLFPTLRAHVYTVLHSGFVKYLLLLRKNSPIKQYMQVAFQSVPTKKKEKGKTKFRGGFAEIYLSSLQTAAASNPPIMGATQNSQS